ncbi:MAG: DUF2974 domain-containing protein [Treponema sp.]|nr:DUF2974 domain-containing protein [Candidatus Treponema equi]
MSDLLDYIDWRGDISFESSPLNEVDALVFCQLSYINFTSVVPSSFTDGISMAAVLEAFASLPDLESRKTQGAFINTKTWTLLEKAATCRRFRDVKLCGYMDKYIPETTEQFSATTFATGQFNFIAYRGTDDTMVGWNEDFNLAYLDKVPAQEDALLYLENAAADLEGTIIIGGHSKGGNLAVYAASKAGPSIVDRVMAIYNNDGPGFKAEFFQEQGFLSAAGKIQSFVPEFSIVGMLFSHVDEYVTVESTGSGIMQHDPFTWKVHGPRFRQLEDTNSKSKYIEKTVNGWINKLNIEQKKVFVTSLFGMLKDTGVSTNTDLASMSHDEIFRIIRNVAEADRQTRKMLFETFRLLAKTAVESIQDQHKDNFSLLN